MTGSQATPVFLLVELPVGEMDVPRDTRGLDLVLDIGLGFPLVIFSVEECLALPDTEKSSPGTHLCCK